MTRKTKIIATIGPSCSKPSVIKKMIQKGVNVCRLNFSHFSLEKAMHSSLPIDSQTCGMCETCQ